MHFRWLEKATGVSKIHGKEVDRRKKIKSVPYYSVKR